MDKFEMYERVNVPEYKIKNALIIGMERYNAQYYYEDISEFIDLETPVQYKLIYINNIDVDNHPAEIGWYLEEYLEKTPLSEIPF